MRINQPWRKGLAVLTGQALSDFAVVTDHELVNASSAKELDISLDPPEFINYIFILKVH